MTKSEREGAIPADERLTARLDHPTAKDCFLHFANGVVIKQREQLAPAHTRSWTFHVEKRVLIPNLYAQKKAEGLAL